jgi:hypothetical protein
MRIVLKILEELEFMLFCILLAAKMLGSAFLDIVDPVPPILLKTNGRQHRLNLVRRPAIRIQGPKSDFDREGR